MPRQPGLPLLVAIACALFLKALVPVGWMPTATDGAFGIEPCPSVTPLAKMVHVGADHGSKHQDPSHKKGSSSECGFAPLSSGFTVVDAVLAPFAPAMTRVELAQPSPAPFFATGPPSPPPPSTGPPALA